MNRLWGSAAMGLMVLGVAGELASCGSPKGGTTVEMNDGGMGSDTPAPESGTAATGCGSYSSGFPVCDQCIQTSCCPEALACSTPDDGGVNSAGLTRCEQLFNCILVCAAGKPDSGVSPPSYGACENMCDPGYSANEYLSVTAIDTCIGTLCQFSCPVQTN
jgi:hypothetical protein